MALKSNYSGLKNIISTGEQLPPGIIPYSQITADSPHVVDRKQDLIITGGQNIYPVEVEEVLYTNPKISLAAVVGVPDKRKGELARAYIVLKEGEEATAEEIINYVRDRIAKFKAPRSVVFVDSLPLGPTGKILKRVLREKVRKDLQMMIDQRGVKCGGIQR